MGRQGVKELAHTRAKLRRQGATGSQLSTDERIDLKVQSCHPLLVHGSSYSSVTVLVVLHMHQFANKLLGSFAKVQNAFRVLDSGRKGLVTYSDFRKALAMFGCPVPEKDMPEIAAVYDPTNSGFIDYQAFNRHVSKLLSPMGGSMVVSVPLGREGPIARRSDRARGAPPACRACSAFVSLAQLCASRN